MFGLVFHYIHVVETNSSKRGAMYRSAVLLGTTLSLSIFWISCGGKAHQDLVVSLSPAAGPGRIASGMGAMGPSSDPIGGQLDLSDEVVKGVPDTLTDLHVRFVDFQWNLILSEVFTKGRIDSSTYNSRRDRTLHVDLPQEPIDQHIHYAIGRNRSGDFVIIFDTDKRRRSV